MADDPRRDQGDSDRDAPPAATSPPRRALRDRRLSRRALLVAGVATAGAAGYAVVQDGRPTDGRDGQAPGLGSGTGTATPGEIDRRTVAAREQPLAAYALTIGRLAEDVDLGAGGRGQFGANWWRDDTSAFNARVSEQVLSLVWFFANDRPWHAYAGDPALLEAADAVLDHYLDLQHDDGSWPELAPDDHSTAATAFALGYLSRTLSLLERSRALPRQQRRLRSSLARGSRWFLTPALNTDWSAEPLDYTNQLIVGLAGCALALEQHGDPGVATLLAERVRDAVRRVQSPAGFLYEAGGMDIGYNLNVSLPRLAELHHALGSAPFRPVVDDLADWWGFALLPEPDGSGFVAFAAPATRTPTRYLDTIADAEDPVAPASSLVGSTAQVAPFLTSREDRTNERQRWAASTAALEPDPPNPRVISNLALPETLPSSAERHAAIGRLPPVAQSRFVESRTSGDDQLYLFVRRPRYYVQAYFGARASSAVRAGLGTLWTPGAGTFVHASAGDEGDDADCSWGAVVPGQGDSEATVRLRASVLPEDGRGTPRDLTGSPAPAITPGPEPTLLRWTDPDGIYRVDARLTDTSLRRSVVAPTGSVEQVPLLLAPTDRVRWLDGRTVTYGKAAASASPGIVIARGSTTLQIGWSGDGRARVTPLDMTYFRDARRQLHLLHVPLTRTTTVTYSVG